MKHLLKSFFFAALAFIFCSCNHYYYSTPSNNVPMLRQKGQMTLAGNAVITQWQSGGELQAAYSPASHVGVMLNGNMTSDNATTTYRDDAYIQQVEAGAGYYAPFRSDIVFEAYAGAGWGRCYNAYPKDETSRTRFTRYFIQPSIGFGSEDSHIQFAIAVKLSTVHFAIKNSNVSNANEFYMSQIDNIRENPNAAYLDPSMLFRIGPQKFKVQLSYCNSIRLSGAYVVRPNMVYALGFVYKFRVNK